MARVSNYYQVGIGPQSGFGTPAASLDWIKWLSLTVEPQESKVFDEGTLGNAWDVNKAKVYRKVFNLSVSTLADRRLIGHFFRATAGAISTNGSGPYEHTFPFVVHSGTAPFYTFGAYEAGSGSIKIKDAVVNTFSMKATMEEPVSVEMEFIANDHESASLSPSYLTNQTLYTPNEVKVEIDTDQNFNSPVELEGTEFSVEINRNLKAQQTFKSGFKYGHMVWGNLEVTVSVKLVFEDNTYRDLIFSNEVKAIRFTAEDTTVDLGGGTHPKIQFILPAATATSDSRDLSKGEIIGETVEFRGVGTDAPRFVLANEWPQTEYLP